MLYSLEINMDNAAFDDEPGVKLARILRNLADEVENWPGGPFALRISDSNGNKIGEHGIDEDDEGDEDDAEDDGE